MLEYTTKLIPLEGESGIVFKWFRPDRSQWKATLNLSTVVHFAKGVDGMYTFDGAQGSLGNIIVLRFRKWTSVDKKTTDTDEVARLLMCEPGRWLNEGIIKPVSLPPLGRLNAIRK